jgi:hypothetical protein
MPEAPLMDICGVKRDFFKVLTKVSDLLSPRKQKAKVRDWR